MMVALDTVIGTFAVNVLSVFTESLRQDEKKTSSKINM
jgi:hypothetical protein